ncbi:MAG: ABC transporter substrate-binding protein [Candidatus Nanopelagicaceae bacterium]
MKITYTRLRALVAALFAATAVVLPGVTSASAATELTFWSWRTEDKAFYESQIKLFEAKNPGITVKFTPYLNTEYNAIVSTALTAGKGPDIVQLRPYGAMANLMDAGYFLPLTNSSVPALKKLSPGILAAAQGYKDKKQYGLPYAVSALGVMYNPEILSAAGVKALPQTMSQMVTAFEKVKKAGYLPLGNAGGNGPALEQLHATIGPSYYGGTQFFNDVVAGKKTFTDKGYVASLKAVADLAKYMPANYQGIDYNTARGLFANEKAAFYIGGNYEMGYFRSVNPSINIGWFPAPKAKLGAKRYVGTWGDGSYAINSKTTDQAAALKFLNFLGTKEFGQALVDEIAFIPTAPYVKINDQAVKEINRWLRTLGTPFLNVVGFRYENPTSSSILQPGFQKLIVGGTTPEQLAKDVQTAVASWYTPQKGKS